MSGKGHPLADAIWPRKEATKTCSPAHAWYTVTGSMLPGSTSVPPVGEQFSGEGIWSSWGPLKLAYLLSLGIQGSLKHLCNFLGKTVSCEFCLSPSPPPASVTENLLHLGCYWCKYCLVAKDKMAGIKFLRIGTSFVVQWLRIQFAMQGVWVWSLDQGTRIPHAKEQLSQRATTRESMGRNERSYVPQIIPESAKYINI